MPCTFRHSLHGGIPEACAELEAADAYISSLTAHKTGRVHVSTRAAPTTYEPRPSGRGSLHVPRRRPLHRCVPLSAYRIGRVETSKRTTTHWVYGIFGIVALIISITGFFGWPRPFDPEAWSHSLALAAIGLCLVWQLAVPQSGWLPQTVGVALIITALVIHFAEVPWPF